MKDLPIKHLLVVHNELAAQVEKKPLKSWTKAKSGLIERIEALQAEVSAQSDQPTKKRAFIKGAKPSDHGSELYRSKQGFGEFIVEKHNEGMSNADILEALKAEWPDHDWDHRRWYPAWYIRQAKRKAAT